MEDSKKSREDLKKDLAFLDMFIMNTKDVMTFEGVGIKTAQKYLRETRIYFDRDPKHRVTLEEYSIYRGIPISYVEAYKKREFELWKD